jgi:hypothetical protein
VKCFEIYSCLWKSITLQEDVALAHGSTGNPQGVFKESLGICRTDEESHKDLTRNLQGIYKELHSNFKECTGTFGGVLKESQGLILEDFMRILKNYI